MLKEYIRRLKSQDVAERRAAIKDLARLRNEAAIPLLETVAQSDPEAELRALAEKAIRYIRQNTQELPTPLAEAAEKPPSGPTPRRYIPPREREAARKYVNAAFNYYQAGDRARAVEWLGKGLSLNPNLQKDAFVEGIVQNTMQMSIDEALPILTNPDRRKAYIAQIGGKAARLGSGHVPKDATWSNALIDLGLYGVVVALSQFALLYFAVDMLRELAQRSPELLTVQDIDALLNMKTRDLLIAAWVGGIYAVFGALVQGAFTHLAATFLLGGQGTLAYLYRKLVPLQTAILLFSTAAVVVLSLVTSPVTALTLSNILSFVVGLVALYLIARAVAEVYNFGVGSGCGAMFLGNIIFIALFFCGLYALLMVLTAALGGA